MDIFEQKLRHMLLEVGQADAASLPAEKLIEGCVVSILKARRLEDLENTLSAAQSITFKQAKILYDVLVTDNLVSLSGCCGSYLPRVVAAARGYADLYARPVRFRFNDVLYEVVAGDSNVRQIKE
jgi:hypothetical protein